jgi:hypothetical protein
VELPRSGERGKHLAFGLRLFNPTLPSENVLGDVLARSEAIEDGATTESPWSQTLVDRAGEVVCQILTG